MRNIRPSGQALGVTSAENGASTIVVWAARVAWLGVGLVAPWSVLADDSSASVRGVLLAMGWFGWVVVLVALLVPSAISLTASRILVPLAVIASFAALDPLCIIVSMIAAVLVLSPDVCDALVQGGAYGAEVRYLLRTPIPYLAPAVLVWAALVSSVVTGPLLLAVGRWWAGIPVSLVAALLCWKVPVRLHRLSRRWLVLVPAGIVVHDHLVLAETMMLRRSNISMVAERRDNDDAADLTGGVLGTRILVRMQQADKVLLSPITMKTLGVSQALHVQSFTVSPRRIVAARDGVVSPRG